MIYICLLAGRLNFKLVLLSIKGSFFVIFFLFLCRFYLCLWYKDDPDCHNKTVYYLSRLKSKAILRDISSSVLLSRTWAKKISLALGQKNSFSRGFDKILSLLLVSYYFY